MGWVVDCGFYSRLFTSGGPLGIGYGLRINSLAELMIV